MNPYETLGVPPGATPDEIQAAYRKQSMRWHPDRPDGDGERMADINAAFELLSDPELRADYDAGGHDVRSYVTQVFRAGLQSLALGARPGDIVRAALTEVDTALQQLHQRRAHTVAGSERLRAALGRLEGGPLFDHAVRAELEQAEARLADLDAQLALVMDVRKTIESYRDKMAVVFTQLGS
jgi:curved DNA-binding protein CbpA